MKAIIEKQINDVNSLVNDLQKATSVLAFEYHGVDAKAITAMRRALHKANAKMYVAKNNIFNRALKQANFSQFNELAGPNALIVAQGDEIVPFKQIHELMKAFKQVVFKQAAIGSTMIEASQLAELASIPSKEGLFSMLLSCLQGSIRNLAYGLKAVSEHKQ